MKLKSRTVNLGLFFGKIWEFYLIFLFVEDRVRALRTKIQFAEELLSVLERLDAGECALKGFLCYEIVKANKELSLFVVGDFTIESKAMKNFQEIAQRILSNDISAPADLDEVTETF